MNKPFNVWKDVYVVGSAELSHSADCMVYLVNCGELVLIDTGAGLSFSRLVSNIESLGFEPAKLSTVILTHGHIDHTGAAWQFSREFNSQIIAHELDAEAIESGVGIGAEYYHMAYQPCTVKLRLQGKENRLKFGSHEFHPLHIPGHTPGHVVFYNKEAEVLIAGDVLFYGSIGRTDLPGGNHNDLITNIKNKLFVLPDNTKVYCGHGPETTLGFEKSTNPFLT